MREMKGSKKIEIPARRSNGEPKASIVRTIIQIFREREGEWEETEQQWPLIYERESHKEKREEGPVKGEGECGLRAFSLSLSFLGKRGTCAGMWTIFFIYLFFPPLHVM